MKNLYHIAGIIILSYFVFFLKLDCFQMRLWDESLFAVNTYEMLHNGKYFSTYFDGVADLYNTKPPLTCWIQLIFVKFFGYNELSLRLPSAIAGCLSVISIFVFIDKHFNRTFAWLSALILITSVGFINFHTARTADSDSLLTLFLLLCNFSFLSFIHSDKQKYILFFFLFISLAFATKFVAALLFTPAYLIVLLVNKRFKTFVFNRTFLGGILFFLSSVFALLYLRESDTPGYLNLIFLKDAGRVFTVIENHKEPFLYYIDNLFNTHFSIWAVLAVLGGFSVFLSTNKKEKTLLSGLLLLTFVYLLIISLSITKLEWYDMPLYPYLSILAAYPIYILLQNIKPLENTISLKVKITFIILIFAYPYYLMFIQSQSQGTRLSEGEKKLEANERFIFEKSQNKVNLNGIKVYYKGFKSDLLFYKYKLAENNQAIKLCDKPDFNINDKILVCNDSLKKVLSEKYIFTTIDCYCDAQLLQISGIIN